MWHSVDKIGPFQSDKTSKAINVGIWLLSTILTVSGVVLAFMFTDKGTVAPTVAWIVALVGCFLFVVNYLRIRRAVARVAPPTVPQEAVSMAALVPPLWEALLRLDPARKVYDLFDLRTVERARSIEMDPTETASFLSFAREFVDMQYALDLFVTDQRYELDNHLDACIERALVAFQAR